MDTGAARLAALLLCAASLLAQTPVPEPPTLRIPRVSRPPCLEDFLEHSPREAEARVTDFRQYEPGDGVPASQPTAAYLSYDDRNLYVVFVCRDEPARIRARLAKREDIADDDKVVVNLDTFHDHRHAYRFSANPLGVQLDSLWTEGQGGDDTWDTVWHSRGQLTEDGYIVWIAIPFRSLRFPRAPLQNWAIELGRAIQRNNEMSTWPQTTQRIESFAQQFAALEGVENISPGRNLQFIPYFVFSRSRALDPFTSPPAFRNDTEARPGLDAKLVLRDALTFDFTVNPDFSQVESDEPQVTVNQRFEVFFPEKRPFFIENAGYFVTPINLFFSRRIADPQAGARLTGKLGRWSLGFIAMDDRAPGKQVPPGDPLRGERAAIAVARVQREFANQSTVGVLVTSRDFAGAHNRVFSLDTRLKLDANWVLTAQAIHSDTLEQDGHRFTGPSYWAELSHTGRHLVYAARYLDHSPNFRADLGFIPRVDVRKMEHYFRYYWKPKQGPIVLFGPDITVNVNWNRLGQVQEWVVDTSFGGNLRGQTDGGCRHQNIYELFQGLGFRRHFTDCGTNIGWLKWLLFTADYGFGSAINYQSAAPLPPFVGEQSSATLGFTLRPTPRFRFEQKYLYTRLGMRRGQTPVVTASGASIFDNHILRTKVNYQFTRRLSLRAILDYNAVLSNPMLVALEPTKRLTGDLLATYMVNPGTAFYVGYTDIYENLQFGPMAPWSRRIGGPDTSTGRQFFVKMSYLFRY
jgi:hypothetical protein